MVAMEPVQYIIGMLVNYLVNLWGASSCQLKVICKIFFIRSDFSYLTIIGGFLQFLKEKDIF